MLGVIAASSAVGVSLNPSSALHATIFEVPPHSSTILGAVTPVPDSLSEYAFAGLLRGNRTELVKCRGNDLQVPTDRKSVV